MNDGGPVEAGNALSSQQQEAIMQKYRALERLFFCMGLSAFMSNLLMDVTLRVKSIELGVEGDEDRWESGDESALVQKGHAKPKPVEEPQQTQFNMLADLCLGPGETSGTE